jgi:hypothetical protein
VAKHANPAAFLSIKSILMTSDFWEVSISRQTIGGTTRDTFGESHDGVVTRRENLKQPQQLVNSWNVGLAFPGP